MSNKRVLVTGGAGFIGSNLCEDLIKNDNEVVCLDNFSTGSINNILSLTQRKSFELIVGDIRNLGDCNKAMNGVDIVLHQAALGSVPRSINDPITTNSVNIDGFLNVLVAARDAKVSRIVYAASSSTYGDSKELPKVEDIIGMPLSPYAVTKYVNELYAHVFGITYGLDIIGLRYFNVYGRNQTPNGAYAAVIPKFIQSLMAHESPVINGDGTNSRDFTYIDNVIQMNNLAATSTNKEAVGQVFNTAVGERTTLNMMVDLLQQYLSDFDPEIAEIKMTYGPERIGDIPHSLASIDKARHILKYNPSHTLEKGLKASVQWYWKSLSALNKDEK
ncbi:MAG: SDR family oxidoreductase [Flavobacterium sp.]|nr:MAG: SDR family oxidoreductase [Flavobacterium sp.]